MTYMFLFTTHRFSPFFSLSFLLFSVAGWTGVKGGGEEGGGWVGGNAYDHNQEAFHTRKLFENLYQALMGQLLPSFDQAFQ